MTDYRKQLRKWGPLAVLSLARKGPTAREKFLDPAGAAGRYQAACDMVNRGAVVVEADVMKHVRTFKTWPLGIRMTGQHRLVGAAS